MRHANQASSYHYSQLHPLIQIWSLLAPKIKDSDSRIQDGNGQTCVVTTVVHKPNAISFFSPSVYGWDLIRSRISWDWSMSNLVRVGNGLFYNIWIFCFQIQVLSQILISSPSLKRQVFCFGQNTQNTKIYSTSQKFGHSFPFTSMRKCVQTFDRYCIFSLSSGGIYPCWLLWFSNIMIIYVV